MEKIITKIFEGHVKAFNDEELTIDHFISTEAPDRVNDVMRADGMEMDGVPTVLKQHGKDIITGNEPIAKPLSISTSTTADGVKGILVKTKYYNGNHLTPPDNTGQRLYEKAKENFMPYWSIGFKGVEGVPRAGGGIDFKKWKLFEYSQVGVPENIQARVLKSMDADEVKKEANNILSFGFEKEDVPDLAIQEMGDTLKGMSEDLIKSGLTIEDITNAIKILTDGGDVVLPDEDVLEKRFDVLAKKEGMTVDEYQELLLRINAHKNRLKSIAGRVAQDIPWDAMRSVWFAMLDELWVSDGSPKAVKTILKELIEIITPFAEAFALATTEDNDMIEIKNQITKQLYIDAKGDVADPAPTSSVNKTKPPSAIVNAVLQLQKKSKPKSVLNIGKKELSDIMKGAVSIELKSALDKMKGKV